MSFADSSSTQVAIIEETLYGVTPATATGRMVRVTGESLDYTINKQASDEINSRRTVTGMVPVGGSTSGGLNTEVSYLEYDMLFEHGMRSSFSVYGTNGVSSSFTADFTATTITASAAPTGANAFTNLKKGQFFRLATGGANNGKICRVSKTVAPTSTVITVEASTPLVVGSAVSGCTVATSRISNGTTGRSLTIERQNADIAEYWAYRGQVLNTFNIEVNTGSKSTMSFEFIGKDAHRQSGSSHITGPIADSKTFDIHAGPAGPVCYLWVDGAPVAGTFVRKASISYGNALRAREAACELGAVSVGSGTIDLKASLTVYFADGELFDKYVANGNIEVVVSTLDSYGNGYIFTLPVANLTKVGTNAGGKDQDMELTIELTGLEDIKNADPALRKVMFIDRVGVAAV